MRELALHLLDIAENSIAAKAQNITIEVEEDVQNDRLIMCVQDDGVGMDADMTAQVVDPFITSRTTRKVGLGLPLLKAAAEACQGNLTIFSTPGKGTFIKVDFQRSHIDLMPLGNLPDTFLSLLISSPQIHWIFRYRSGSKAYIFDDTVIKTELKDIPLSEPTILTWLRETIEEGIKSIQPPAPEIRWK